MRTSALSFLLFIALFFSSTSVLQSAEDVRAESAALLAGIEILDGLDEGEEVVTAGVRRLSDGMAVKVFAAGPAESEA